MIYKRITKYEVCALPPDDNIDPITLCHFTISVEWRGGNDWAVCQMGDCLSSKGKWDYERQPSSRTDKWKKKHRFTLERALELATEAAPLVVVNGHTVDDVLSGKFR